VSTIEIGNYIAKNRFDHDNLISMHRRGFTNFNFIYNCIKYPTSDQYLLRNLNLKNSLPEIWFKTLDKFNNVDTLISPLDYVYCGTNIFKSIGNIKTKDIRENFTYRKCEKVDLTKVKNLFSLDIVPNNVFTDIRKFTINNKLRFTHYRILHNDLYTKSKLNKIGLVDNPLCDRCLLNEGNECIEDVNHLLLTCPHSIECWRITENVLSKLTRESIKLDKNKILLGFNHTETKHFNAINTILAKVRNNFIQIKRPTWPNYDKIIMNQIKELIYIEKMFLDISKFDKKWRIIITNIESDG